MKTFLFILSNGHNLGNIFGEIEGNLPSEHELKDVIDRANSGKRSGFVVIDFKEIAND